VGLRGTWGRMRRLWGSRWAACKSRGVAPDVPCRSTCSTRAKGAGGAGGMYSQQHTMQQYPTAGGGHVWQPADAPGGPAQRNGRVRHGHGHAAGVARGGPKGEGEGGYGPGGGHPGNGPMMMNSLSQEFVEELQGGGGRAAGHPDRKRHMPGGGAEAGV